MQSFLNEQEVSKRLNVSVATLRRWRLEKRGPTFVKVGSFVRYRAGSRLVGGGAPNRWRSGRRCGCRDDQPCLILIARAEKKTRLERSSMVYKRIGHWHLDVTIHGVRYREALNTTDKRQAKEIEKNRIAEIKQGKNASKTGREFARKPFHEAVKVYLEEREPHVSERTMQFETERLRPLVKHFSEKPLLRFKAKTFPVIRRRGWKPAFPAGRSTWKPASFAGC